MLRDVTLTRLADRHIGLHTRDFAETERVAVPDGDLADVAAAAIRASTLSTDEAARLIVIIDEPRL